MSYLYNSRNNRRRAAPPSSPAGQPIPTLADYQALAKAFEELKTRFEEQGKTLQNTKSELEIKNEALHRQSEEFKKLEAETVFLRAALEDTHQQAASAEETTWQEKYVRLQAEVDNLRKRWEQRFGNESAEFRRRVLVDMLPLADHLDLAMQHAPTTDAAAVKNFIGNIEATRRAFLETLRRYGVERIDPIGEPFDPTLHEAVGHAPSADVPAEHVAQVVQAGYMEGDRLLRAARVLVSG
jgi:molecular chaperone GrpE